MSAMRFSTALGCSVSLFFCIYIVSLSGGSVSAALLSRRQADDFSAEHPNDSETPDQLTSLAVTAPAPTTAIEPVANATAASNGTVKATPVSSAAAVASTVSSPLNSTNDPNMCHVTQTIDPEGEQFITNPFCKPFHGQEVYPNLQYQVTWDPTLFGHNANDTIQVYSAENNGLNSPSTAKILDSLTATNFQGSVFLNMSSAWLKDQSTANLTLNLIVEEEGKDAKTYAGPFFTLLSTSSSSESSHSEPSSSSSTSPSSDKKLGEKVGLPIGLVFLIVAAAAIALFLCLRRRRIGKGYGTGKSLRQRVGSIGQQRRHKRGPSFHDEEPTSGSVELRDRNRGFTGETPPEDNWDWGSPVSSPRNGGGNAFRDEIQRQRGGR